MGPLLPIDDDSAPLYTVGQVAGMLDVQPAYQRRLDVEAEVAELTRELAEVRAAEAARAQR